MEKWCEEAVHPLSPILVRAKCPGVSHAERPDQLLDRQKEHGKEHEKKGWLKLYLLELVLLSMSRQWLSCSVLVGVSPLQADDSGTTHKP